MYIAKLQRIADGARPALLCGFAALLLSGCADTDQFQAPSGVHFKFIHDSVHKLGWISVFSPRSGGIVWRNIYCHERSVRAGLGCVAEFNRA